MTVMDHIIVGTQDWDEFVEDAEVVTTFESKDGPNFVVAVIYRDSPAGAGGCTLHASMYVQDPAPAPTLEGRDLGGILAVMDAPELYADEVLDVRGTFLEGVKRGAMHHAQFAETHPSIGAAVLRLAALSHAHATGRMLDSQDDSKAMVVLDALTMTA